MLATLARGLLDGGDGRALDVHDLNDFTTGLGLVHGIDYVQVVQGHGVDAFLVLVERVHGVRVQLKDLHYHLCDVIKAIVEVKQLHLDD